MVLLFDTIHEYRCMQFAAKRTFYLDGLNHETLGIQQIAEIAFFGARVFYRKQSVVQTNFGIQRRIAFYPVDSRLRFAVSAFGARFAVRNSCR